MIDGLRECGCIPGHRSTILTHACQVCGLRDCDVEDGKPIPPCVSSQLKIGDRVPMPPRKLVIRPNAPIDNRPSFKPARNGKKS